MILVQVLDSLLDAHLIFFFRLKIARAANHQNGNETQFA